MRTPAETAPQTPEETVPHSPRNFWAWVAYLFFYRTGWQFKMEATLIAGLISYLTPDPRMMGLFGTVATVGRQAAPLAAAPHIDRFPRKRQALLLYWSASVACWAGLAGFLWLPVAADRRVTLWVFAAAYTLFFIFLGAATVAQGALLGKIIPATMRGRALAAGMGLSGAVNVGAILGTYFVLRQGNFPTPRNYALAFSITVFCFLLAVVALLAVSESPSPARHRAHNLRTSLRALSELVREHRNLRVLMAVNVAVAVGGSMLQFYTGLWRQSSGPAFPETAIVIATVTQVFWQSLSSALLGRVADERGNKVVICSLLWVEAIVPLAAIWMSRLPPSSGPWSYLLVYTLIGIRFPMYQLLVNYLLEVLPMREHAMGLGATNFIQILTAPAPLLLGSLARASGYPAAFVCASIFLGVAAVVALRLEEPRRRVGVEGDR